MSDNPFLELPAASTAQGTNSRIAGKVSAAARGEFKNVLKKDGRIDQTERLFSTRARYAKADATDGTSSTDAGGNRGNWAFIKLLTSDKQKEEYKNGSTTRDVTNKHLLGNGGLASKLSTSGYDGFMVTGVSCAMSEKVQISEVFGDGEVVYYFGRQPLVFNIQGVLIDSVDNDWFYDWLCMYNDFLRGSQAAKNYELLKIILPNMTIVGTISGFSWQQDSSRDTDIPFSFQFIAKTVTPKPASGSPVINSNKISGVDFSSVTKFLPQSGINSLKGQVEDLSRTIQNPNASLREKGVALNKLGSGVGGTFGSFLEKSKGDLNSYKKSVDGWNSAGQKYARDVQTSAMFQTVTSSLNGIRTNLFSPVYGILSSLTKLVSNSFNSVNNIFNALITPVRNILRDITSISRQSIALVNLVNNSIKGVGRNINSQLKGTRNDFKTAIKTMGKAAGTLAAAPITAGQSVKSMFSSGALPYTAAFLTSTPKLAFVRPSLNITGRPVKPKTALITDTPEYSSKTANSL